MVYFGRFIVRHTDHDYSHSSEGGAYSSDDHEKRFPLVRSNRTNIFHVRECEWAKKIKRKNMVEYSSATDARKAGLRPCFECEYLIRRLPQNAPITVERTKEFEEAWEAENPE